MTTNLYLSLGIIAVALCFFMTYGLYKGIGLIDNFPKLRDFKTGNLSGDISSHIGIPSVSIDDGIGGSFSTRDGYLELFI